MVRKFLSEDFQQCCELLIQTYNAPPVNDNWTSERAQIRLKDTIDNKRFIGYTLWENDVLAGAVFARGRTNHAGNEIVVEDLFVSPAHQRKGYGAMLLDAIEKYSKENGCMNISLITAIDNPSFDFYKKCGYWHLDFAASMYKRTK